MNIFPKSKKNKQQNKLSKLLCEEAVYDDKLVLR